MVSGGRYDVHDVRDLAHDSWIGPVLFSSKIQVLAQRITTAGTR